MRGRESTLKKRKRKVITLPHGERGGGKKRAARGVVDQAYHVKS